MLERCTTVAVSKEAIEQFLNKPVPGWPDWKTEDIHALQTRIARYTGKPFQRSKGPPLYGHQFRALTAALLMERILVFMGMRTGKTRVAFEWAAHLRRSGQWKGLGIVIVPGPTAVAEWANQAPNWCDLKVLCVYGTDVEEFLNAVEANVDLVVLSWYSLQYAFTKKQMVQRRGKPPKPEMVPDLEALSWVAEEFSLCVIDEIHYCANRQSLRYTLGSLIAQHCRWRMGLTGTPFGRYPLDIWPQAHIIDSGQTLTNNYYFFEAAFGVRKKNPFNKRGFELVFDENKLLLFTKKLGSISIAYKLSEVRDIKVTGRVHNLTPHKLQKAAVDELLEPYKSKESIGKVVLEGIFTKLRHISAGLVPYVNSEGKRDYYALPNSAKRDWLVEQIEEGMFESPVVIFHEHTLVGKLISDILTKKKVKHTWLYGETKNKPKAVADFKAGKVNCIICNSKSGSVAIDLARADYLIFYESPASPTLRAQAEARPLGPRDGRLLFVDDLVCLPVDARMLKYAKEGQNMLDMAIHSGKQLYKLFGVR